MNKKRLSKYAIGLIILMITTQITSGYSSGTIKQCSLFTQTISANNPKIYNDVKILMISRMYESIEIDGFHNYNYGNGHDDNIALRDSNRIYIIGILVIWDDSEIKEFSLRGGWVHTKIEIFDYDGWMSGQDTLSHLRMFGNCKTIEITVYRGHSSYGGINKKINTCQPTYSFNDVNITMLSGYVKKTSINGYHKWHGGCGDWGWLSSITHNFQSSVWGEPDPTAPNGIRWHTITDEDVGHLDMAFELIKGGIPSITVDILPPGILIPQWDVEVFPPIFTLTNYGNAVDGLDWFFKIEGDFVFMWLETTGTIDLAENEKELFIIRTFGIGPVLMTAEVIWEDEIIASDSLEGFLFGPLLIEKI